MSERKVILTTCTRDCPDACGIHAHVSGGRLVGLTGVREHEITRGFLCRRAADYIRRVYSPDRVVRPLRKVGGRWQEMSWDEAFDLIAASIEKTIDVYGSQAILHYQSGGSLAALKMFNKRFFNLLGGVTEAVGSLCGGAGIAGQTMDFGYRTSHDPKDLLKSKLIVLWGRNPSVTNTHLIPILKEARAGGAQIVLIDPANTRTAKFCDVHVRPHPGMDGYLVLGMAKIILDSDNMATDFVLNRCENFDAYRAMVKRYDLAFLSEASGVPVEMIEHLAGAYMERKPAAIICGWGLQRYQWGAETFRLIDALGAITGNIGVPGGGVSHGRDEQEYFDQSIKSKELADSRRTIPKPLMGRGLRELDGSPVKLAFINGGNPLNQLPDVGAATEAFRQIDMVVVFEQFLTDTAMSADIVLPVTTFLEETDVVASYWHSFISPVNPAIEPVGEAKSDFDIYQGIASRLGIGHEMAGTANDWLRKIIAPLNDMGITLEALKEGHMRIPSAPLVAFEQGAFKTKSGKFRFVTDFSNPSLGSKEYPLFLLTPHSSRWIHSQVLPEDHGSPVDARVNPATARAYEVEDGSAARVVSPKGSVDVIIKHDEGLKEGIVYIEQGSWGMFGKSVNQLTHAIMSDEGQNACYYQTTVHLEKA
ncbi:MAG TPA: molybdopterin-dependent oxidoreductase [Anaerolineae bacterium]|nr:molybdopterin-dependent oxidoreductase [Anaerolineae bacterium]